jgi:hypothetical protein
MQSVLLTPQSFTVQSEMQEEPTQGTSLWRFLVTAARCPALSAGGAR